MDAQTQFIVFAVGAVMVVIIAVIVILMMKNRKKGKKAYVNPDVLHVLKKHVRLRDAKFFNNVAFSDGEKTITVDHVLIGIFGVMLIDAREERGEIYGEEKDKTWTHKAGERKISFQNPLRVLEEAEQLLRKRLAANNIYGVPIERRVVFTVDSAKALGIYVPENLPYSRLKGFKALLQKKRYDTDNGVDVEKIAAIVKQD